MGYGKLALPLPPELHVHQLYRCASGIMPCIQVCKLASNDWLTKAYCGAVFLYRVSSFKLTKLPDYLANLAIDLFSLKFALAKINIPVESNLKWLKIAKINTH